MACQWQEAACEQLAFWTSLLGAPDVFNAGPSGDAIWYAAALGRSTFLGEPITWLKLRISDRLRPLTIDARIKLGSAAIGILERDLLTLEYTLASAVVTFTATDQVNFVAAWATILGINAGRNMHRAAAALEDTERILRLAYGSGNMQRLRDAYNPAAADAKIATEVLEPQALERSAAPRPPVRVLPNETRGTVLERRNPAAAGPVSARVDSKETELFHVLY